MSAHRSFCSHCGSAQMSGVATGPLVLHCASCHGITISLGHDWANLPEGAVSPMPLPPMVSYQENEFACGDCEAALSLEITLRSPGKTCARCSHLDQWTVETPPKPTVAAALSREELDFLAHSTF